MLPNHYFIWLKFAPGNTCISVWILLFIHKICKKKKGYWFIKDVLPTLENASIRVNQTWKKKIISILKKYTQITRIHSCWCVCVGREGGRETRCRREWWLWEGHGDETPFRLRFCNRQNWDANEKICGARFLQEKFHNSENIFLHGIYSVKIL